MRITRRSRSSSNAGAQHAPLLLDEPRKKRRPQIADAVGVPKVVDVSETGAKRRAEQTGRKFVKKRTLALVFSALGVAIPSEVIGLGLICGPPLLVAAFAFTRSRLQRDTWADIFELGTIAIFLCAVLVLFRGVYVASDATSKVLGLAGQISTGVPSSVWNGLWNGSFPGIASLHLIVAAAMFGVFVVCARTQIKDQHLSRPPKPDDYKSAQALKPRKARKVPGKTVN